MFGCCTCNQGAKKNGRRNERLSLVRCVMRSETGARALETEGLKKMAANEVRWLLQKTDCYKITVHDFLIHFMKIAFQYVFKAVGNKERAIHVKTTTISF